MRSNHNENEDEIRSHRYGRNRPTIPDRIFDQGRKIEWNWTGKECLISTFAHFFTAIAKVQYLEGSLSDLRFEVFPMLLNIY